MSDEFLASTDQKEELSRIYVAAVVASAGFTLATQNYDRDGVDIQIRSGGHVRPSLDIQLKATTKIENDLSNEIKYPLLLRNYELLREPSLVPRILVIFDLPLDENLRVEISPEELVMRRCAYWSNLREFPETDNKKSVTIQVKKQNRFNVKSLKNLMKKVGNGINL